MVQWLRLHASNAEGTVSIPGQGTKNPTCYVAWPKKILLKKIAEPNDLRNAFHSQSSLSVYEKKITKWRCSALHKWSRSVVSDSETPWTVAYQASPSMGFSRQEYWSGLPFLSPGLMTYVPANLARLLDHLTLGVDFFFFAHWRNSLAASQAMKLQIKRVTLQNT